MSDVDLKAKAETYSIEECKTVAALYHNASVLDSFQILCLTDIKILTDFGMVDGLQFTPQSHRIYALLQSAIAAEERAESEKQRADRLEAVLKNIVDKCEYQEIDKWGIYYNCTDGILKANDSASSTMDNCPVCFEARQALNGETDD